MQPAGVHSWSSALSSHAAPRAQNVRVGDSVVSVSTCMLHMSVIRAADGMRH